MLTIKINLTYLLVLVLKCICLMQLITKAAGFASPSNALYDINIKSCLSHEVVMHPRHLVIMLSSIHLVYPN